MFKKLLGGKSGTTKADLIMALATGLIGVWSAFDTVRDYNAEQAKKKELNS